MRLATRSLHDMDVAEYNPREPLSDEERAQIRASLDSFGLVEPLVYNERTGRLVGGHQRREVLLEMGEDEAPVSVVDLSEHEEKALNVALNREGRWDPGMLAETLERIRDADLLGVTGYDTDGVDELLEATGDLPDLDAEDGEDEHRGAEYFPVTFALGEDDRAALGAALEATGEADASEALTEICRWYTEGS